MTDERMDILFRCLQRAFEQGTRTWSSAHRSLADWTFNTLERRGLMNPVLEEIRERQQRWTYRIEEQLLHWNEALAHHLGQRVHEFDADEEGAEDQGDPGEEPEDAPELQKRHPSRGAARKGSARRNRAGQATVSRPAKPGPRPRSRRKKS